MAARPRQHKKAMTLAPCDARGGWRGGRGVVWRVARVSRGGWRILVHSRPNLQGDSGSGLKFTSWPASHPGFHSASTPAVVYVVREVADRRAIESARTWLRIPRLRPDAPWLLRQGADPT